MPLAHSRAETPPDMGGNLMRRLATEAAKAGVGDQHQLARPPFGQRVSRFAIAEICVRDAFLVRRGTRVEPRFSRFERMKPVAVFLEQAAFGADAVEVDID